MHLQYKFYVNYFIENYRNRGYYIVHRTMWLFHNVSVSNNIITLYQASNSTIIHSDD